MRFRSIKLATALSVVLLSCVAVGLTGTATRAGATSGPQCTFNGSSLPLVTGVSAGSKVAISCTGMGLLHPYLVIGASLLLGIDPAAAPLLSGQVVSLAALNALLAALPELDLASEALPISGLNGNLSLDWTVPAFQPLDPNASCPPPQKEFNAGLLGCAVAMIDLTTFKPVGAGSAVFEYSGFPLLPPNPTLALSPTTATRGQTVDLSDASGATTYWWLPTLAKLESALGGAGGSAPTVTVTLVDPSGNSVATSSQAQAVPASYSSGVFSPPVLSGSFAVPPTVGGPQTVKVQVTGALNGLPISISASSPLTVDTPPLITSGNATTFFKGSPGTFTVAASGVPASTFSESGALPPGVHLSSAGVLSGTPTAIGAYPIIITAANGVLPNATQAFTLTVAAFGITTNSISPEPARIGTFYQSNPLQAAGGVAPYKWKVTSGTLPKGLKLGSSTGVIDGTVKLSKHPPVPGVYPFTVTVTDHTKQVHLSASANLAITLAS